MHFSTKGYLKNNRYYTAKHALNIYAICNLLDLGYTNDTNQDWIIQIDFRPNKN
jgi:DNA-binding transcriptional MerR regulator